MLFDRNLLSANYRDHHLLGEKREVFEAHMYVRLPNFFSAAAISVLRNEVRRLEADRIKRDFVMPTFGTPRRMHTIGGKTIRTNSQLLFSIYQSKDVRETLEILTGSEIRHCQHESECMVVNFLEEHNATHGWHLDDPPYALVTILEDPGENVGGNLEFVANVERERWDALVSTCGTTSSIERMRAEGNVQVAHHEAGDSYLLRADSCLHRVTPLSSPSVGTRRIAVNMGYEGIEVPIYGATASLLYD